MPSFLANNSLFLRLPDLPTQSDASAEKLLSTLQSSETYDKLIDLTYYLLQDSDLSFLNALKIWEIRLTLHIFNGNLSLAKKEGINLNNELYLLENKGNDDKIRSTYHNSTLDRGGGLPIYPLPKNNDGMITYSLLVLLLRLKSIPNLNLVNEFYKLTYQMRLKANNNAGKELSIKLNNLSYDVIVILTISKNYLTLINFIELITKYDGDGDEGNAYVSNLCLILVIIQLIIRSRKTEGIEDIPPQHLVKLEECFKRISETTLESFRYILLNYGPNLEPSKESPETVKSITLNSLYGLVSSGKISSRTICCTIGLWNLQNRFNFKLVNGNIDQQVEEDVEGGAIEKAFKELCNHWKVNINRVYCLE